MEQPKSTRELIAENHDKINKLRVFLGEFPQLPPDIPDSEEEAEQLLQTLIRDSHTIANRHAAYVPKSLRIRTDEIDFEERFRELAAEYLKALQAMHDMQDERSGVAKGGIF